MRSSHRRAWAAGASALLAVAAASPVWALQRTIKTKTHNYPNAPVEIRHSQVTLAQAFSAPTPTGSPATGARHSRVRYANRDGLTASGYLLTGQTTCVNRSTQAVEAFALTVVAFDAFHQPVQLPGQREAFAVQQIVEPLARGGTAQVGWEQPVGSADIYEVAVVATRVRFADGSVWFAPGEDLIDIF